MKEQQQDEHKWSTTERFFPYYSRVNCSDWVHESEESLEKKNNERKSRWKRQLKIKNETTPENLKIQICMIVMKDKSIITEK
jgi:hypothetical protein